MLPTIRTAMLALALTALFLPVPTLAAPPYEQGWKAFSEGDYAAALPIFQHHAELGHPEAQANLGFMYTKALGVEADADLAAHWLTQAAHGGECFGQFLLGALYKLGEGVPQDHEEGFRWLM